MPGPRAAGDPGDVRVAAATATGIPLVYELEDDLTAICRYYLGDPEKLAKATAAVATQLEKKR